MLFGAVVIKNIVPELKTVQKNSLLSLQTVNLDTNNFNENSLDNFILNQRVTHCWRKVDGEYKLLPVVYTEKWNLSERKNMAQKIISALRCGATAIAATVDNSVIGLALLSGYLFGKNKEYIDLEEFYVSEPFRRNGIGKLLFEKICLAAKKSGAKKLYISAHSAEESISAYKKYGCVPAQEPDAAHVEKEPFDLQLEYDLTLNIYEVFDKHNYTDLLLLADEQKEMVERYINDGTMYVIDDCGVKGEIVVTDVGNNVLEIKNLAVLPEFQHKGYGKKLIEFICNNYKNKFSVVQVGTGDSPLTVPFYEKCGFTKSHVIKNFFTDNYDHPIYENGVRLKDMLFLIKYL